MSVVSHRKLRNQQQILHTGMVAIPFFYSLKPTNLLAIKHVSQQILNSLQTPIHQKVYYKKNKPIITKIMQFQSVQKAKQAKQKITKEMQGKQTKYLCQYCLQISSYNGILFEGGKNYVTFPQTKQMKDIIDTIAQSIVMNGIDVQQKLKQSDEPLLTFLNERILSLQHIYYRWRVYSYMQGDGQKKYRTEPFQITRNGFTWYPPVNQNQYPQIMNFKQVKYLTECLHKMERRKYAIQEIMIFAIHNINYAVHISLIIMIHLMQSLESDFIGIIYLISDILFNSQNNIYRNLFQARLPYIIDSYLLLKQSDQGKAMNDKYLSQLKKLFLIWQKKFIFDQNFMKGMIFMLQNSSLDNMYKLCQIQQHPKIRQIFGGDQYLYELQKNCIQNGIPFFAQKQLQAKIYLNALFWQNDKIADIQPQLGKYDGQAIGQKQLMKIQSKSVKVISCQNLPMSMLFDKNWKPSRTAGLSQDGA